MQQVKIFFQNGVILRSSPMNDWHTSAFCKQFDGNPEVLQIFEEPIEKLSAQEIFRSDAEEWKALAERNRSTRISFSSAIDKVAVYNYHNAMRVGHSG